jgi:hypothetical protein
MTHRHPTDPDFSSQDVELTIMAAGRRSGPSAGSTRYSLKLGLERWPSLGDAEAFALKRLA